jgi:hypothetical protein
METRPRCAAFRLAFDETVSETAMDAIAAVTGRRVLAHHSQVAFDPVRTFEVFVLQPAPAAAQ